MARPQFEKMLIQLNTRTGSQATVKLQAAMSVQFESTGSPSRFWVTGKNWGQQISALWDAALSPDGVEVDGLKLSEDEWQELLAAVGIIEELNYSVVATQWSGQCFPAFDGEQVQDNCDWDTVLTKEQAEQWNTK